VPKNSSAPCASGASRARRRPLRAYERRTASERRDSEHREGDAVSGIVPFVDANAIPMDRECLLEEQTVLIEDGTVSGVVVFPSSGDRN